MRSFLSNLASRPKYKIDFSLIAPGILLLELSILSTDLALKIYPSVADVLLVRFIHALFLLGFCITLSKLAHKSGRNEFSYLELAFSGTSAVIVGVGLTNIIGRNLGIESLSLFRAIGSSLLQGLFWFPVFIMVGSKRTEIFQQFREYEKRLITSTRAQSRGSLEFTRNQKEIQQRIQLELTQLCSTLRNSVAAVNVESMELSSANKAIQEKLKGDDLRKLSMKLETFSTEQDSTSFLGQNTNSFKLLIDQFKILYDETARKAPLKTYHYAMVLIILITPAHINYFTPAEAAISYPLLALAIIGFSKLITMSLATNNPQSRRNSSILIYATGLLPLLANRIGQSITHDPNTDFPIYIGALTLPLGYYIFMKVFQVLQPHAIELIRTDDLRASAALKATVTKIVSDEFSHTLSHRWAIYIHGKILTRLAATALKLETASNAGDKETFLGAVQALLNLLDNPDKDFEQEAIVLESEVASRLDPWLGLLEVDLHIDEDLKLIRNERVHELGEVIEELVSNSMRHGKAQKMTLRVTRLGEKDIQISAIDDATTAPPEFQTRFGLGTRIFNLASDGRWSISRVVSGTEFNLTMAIEY